MVSRFSWKRTGLGMSVATEGTFVYLDFGRDMGQSFAWRESRRGAFLRRPQRDTTRFKTSHSRRTGIERSSNAVDGGRQSFWLYDLARFARTRFDLGTAAEGKRVLGGYWLADDHVYYTLLTPPSAYQLWAKPVDGIGGARTLPFPEGLKVVTDRTRDGQYLVVSHMSAPGKPATDLVVAIEAADGQGEAIDFSRNSQAELYGVLSPDERYLAYTSDISGRLQVHVRPFPEGPGRWQISSNGGSAPVWGPSGTELFFDSGNELMRVRVSTAGGFSVSHRRIPLSARSPERPRGAGSTLRGQRRRQAVPDGGAQIRVSRTGRAGRRELAHRIPSCAFTDARVEVQGMSCHSGRCGSATANASVPSWDQDDEHARKPLDQGLRTLMTDDRERGRQRVGRRRIFCDHVSDGMIRDGNPGARIDDMRIADSINLDELHRRARGRQRAVSQA